MVIRWKSFVLCLAFPLGVGWLSSRLTRDSMAMFMMLEKPPLSPPGWVFPVVWTILFALMGISSYLVLESGEEPGDVRRALTVYALQLAVNFFWSLIFFNWRLYLFAFVWLLLLWVLILATIILFGHIRQTAARLLIPYLLWVTFAGYLNFGIYWLNP